MNEFPTGYPATASEAFAFLSARQKLSADDLKVMALIEQSAEGFYMALARATDNVEVATLLQRNGNEERGHAHRIVKALGLLGVPFALPDVERNPFHHEHHFETLDPNFLATLEQGEFGGDKTYQTWADHEPNAEVARLLRQNGSEESRHGERVAQAQALLSAAAH
jgi:rubrerythrin